MRGRGLFPWDKPTKLGSVLPDTMSEVREATEFSPVGKIILRNVLVDYFLLHNKSEHMDGSVVKNVL